MGMNMSFMGMGSVKGVSASQILSLVTDTLYDQFVEKGIKDERTFVLAILDTFRTINMALPGKHYDAPSHKDVTDLFYQWQQEDNPDNRKKIITDFLKKNVHSNKVDGSMIVTAIVAPPAAMVVKRTGETLPQLKLMKSVPDVVFVPSATVVALIAVKVLGLMFMKKTTSKDAQGQHMGHEAPSVQQQHAHAQEQEPEEATPTPDEDQTEPKLGPSQYFCALCNAVHSF